MNTIELKPIPANSETTREFGTFIGEEINQGEIIIPFYKNSVEEGDNFKFQYRDRVVLRTVRIHPSGYEVRWLERHMHLTQLFVGIGQSPFLMVLSPPTNSTPALPEDLPCLDEVTCFSFSPGTGIILDLGVWHDFPLAISAPVTCLTANSAEVVEALQKIEEPQEMNFGDIYKISLVGRFGTTVKIIL
jgi:ureidoglycolate lyase